jgi:hypothetical protein
MSKEFSYTINKDVTVALHVNAKSLNTIKLTTLITQIQAIYRELENYQQVPRAQVRSKPRKARKMPKGTKVEKVYTALRSSGKDAGSAARIAQSQTGKSLKTGKTPKKK